MDDIWLVLPHLGAGGAQKVAILAACRFSAQGLRLRVVTFVPGVPVIHPPPVGVPHLDLGPSVEAEWLGDHWNRSLQARCRRFLKAQTRRLHRIFAKVLLLLAWPWFCRRALPGCNDLTSRLLRWCVCGISGPQALLLQQAIEREKPARVLAMLTRTNILTCQALWDSHAHLVVSERNDPTHQLLPFPWLRLRKLLYRRADVVTANTEGVLRGLGVLQQFRRVELLPNPLPSALGSSTFDFVAKESRPKAFVSVARLVHQKGIDVLIRAAALTSGSASSWPVLLVGDGPERSSLERQVASEGLSDRVQFQGFCQEPSRFLAASSVFVLPSRFEGMPNALLEAMAAGLAVIVTDASPGPLEMVEHRRSGLVVPCDDASALAEAMEELAGDVELRCRLACAAFERIASLDWSQVESKWRSVLALP